MKTLALDLLSSPNFLLLIFCFIAGVLLRIFKRLPSETPAVLNGFIFHLCLPAVVLLQFHEVSFSGGAMQTFLPAGAMWLLYVGSALLFNHWGKMLGFSPKTRGALILTAGLGNTAFVGYPFLEALYGAQSIKTGILVDQLGTFLILSTLGILTASVFAARGFSTMKVIKRMMAFPPIYALILAWILRPLPYPSIVQDLLARLQGALTPLALVSVGFQMRPDIRTIRKRALPLGLGLFYKLFFAPLLILVLYRFVFNARGEAIQITIIQAAMAPMITAAIVSAEYELDTELANLMVGIGIPLSFFTVPIWFWMLGGIF